MAKRVVLVIDDAEDVCWLIKDALERLGGYTIISAHNGMEGLQLAKQTNPDLVLLDIDMPFMNGFEVLKSLKSDEQTYAIPVVMLTGENSDAFKITAARLYSEEYLTKPISVLALRKRIDTILTRFGT